MNSESTKNDSARGGEDRRAPSDRRGGSERRRNTDIRTPIIHITQSMLRVLIVVERVGEDEDLVVCRSLPWRVEAESLHSPLGAAELKAAFAKLANEERLASTQARILLSGDLCVTRAVTGVSDDVHRETVLLRDRSQLYLSLGPGKKVIASSSTPLDARHSHALLTIATEQTLRVVSQGVESAGMEVAFIGSAQVALAQTVKHTHNDTAGAALVVAVDEGQVELGVVSGGRLFLDYRPGGGADVEQLAEIVGQHHTRLRRYCQRHHGLANEKLSRVIVSGAADDANRACVGVRRLNHVEVELLDTRTVELPWALRGDDLNPEMAAVLGAALSLQEVHTCGPNLVEQLVSTARPPIGRLLARKCAPLAAALIAAVVFGLLDWKMSRETVAMKAQLDQLAPKAARAAALRLELLGGHMELRQLEALGQNVVAQPLSLMLRNLTQSIPNEVWLSDVRIDGNQMATIAGSSYAESSIYDFVSELQQLPGIGQVALQGTGVGRTAHRDATTFDIHLELQLAGDAEKTKEDL